MAMSARPSASNNTSTAGGAYVGLSVAGLLLLLLCAACLCWCWRTRVDKDDILVTTRGHVTKHAGRSAKMGSEALNITKFMDLHVDNCKKHPFNQVAMVSATDYVASLNLPGNFSWKRAMKTALVKSELKMMLPLTDLMGRPDGPVDPFAALGGSRRTYSVMRDTLSPLHLYALGELMNLAVAESREAAANTMNSTMLAKVSTLCVDKFLDGERSEMLPPDMARLPEPFILDEHLPKLLQGLDPDAPVKDMEEKEGVEWMPDVSFSHVGVKYRDNEYQVKCGLVFAVLLNRLSANTMPENWKPKAWRGRHTSVKLTAKGPAMWYPGELIRAITDELGAKVQMMVVNRVTSFGQGMSLKQDDTWYQIPFVVPVRTGVVMLDGDTASSGTNEIVTLMGHSEVALRVNLPGRFSFKISWYQGMEGFTGWHGGNDTVCPWNNGPETEVQHSCWSTSRQYAAAADVTATVACVTNRMADELSLPNGGYGYLGVCNDSVATIQAALEEPVTMFPCILAGQAMTQMAQTYAEVSEGMRQAGGQWLKWADVADRVRKGLLRTPCDVLQDPTTVDTAIRRIQACLPDITPFQTLEHARKDLDRALEQYTQSGLLNSTPGGGASPRLSQQDHTILPVPPV